MVEARPASLQRALAAAVPKGVGCNIRHIHTPSKSCDPLFSPPPACKPEKTRRAAHFFALSIAGIPDSVNANTLPSSDQEDVLALGIEILVYTTKYLTTIFVSKADSTGFIPQSPASVSVKPVVAAIVQWIVDEARQKHVGRQVVVSLFARAQSQYLFPGSVENAGKHVLDDRQLIRWWAKVLNPLLQRLEGGTGKEQQDWTPARGYMTVPGFEGSELRQFFPTQDLASRAGPCWQAGNPLRELADTRGLPPDAPPRCLLPRFPDDPKARFIRELDEEVGLVEDSIESSPTKRRGREWSTILDLGRFWEAMEFRQECSSGRMVGFLWVVMPTKAVLIDDVAQEKNEDDILCVPSGQSSSQQASALSAASNISTRGRTRKTLTGPIVPRKPRLKGGSSSLSANSAGLSAMVDAAAGNDGLPLTNDGYNQAMSTLLHLDFATFEVAARSTAKWVAELSSISGLGSDFAVKISGEAKPAESTRDGRSGGAGQVNDLGSMIRRKRKASDRAEACVETAAPLVTTLSASSLRKKPKPGVT